MSAVQQKLVAEPASAAKPVVEQQQEVAKSVSAMMLPRAVALAKATALPLPASPLNATPGEAPARTSGNAQVSKGCVLIYCVRLSGLYREFEFASCKVLKPSFYKETNGDAAAMASFLCKLFQLLQRFSEHSSPTLLLNIFTRLGSI